MKQYDLFGGCQEVAEIPKISHKFKTMQEQYGTLEGSTCNQCFHHIRHDYHNKYYHKCMLWKLSHSTATDIRCKDIACKKFIPK